MPEHGTTIGEPGPGGIRTDYGKKTREECQTLCGSRPSGCCEWAAGLGICTHFVDGVQDYSSGHDDTTSVMCATSCQDTHKDCYSDCKEGDGECYGLCGQVMHQCMSSYVPRCANACNVRFDTCNNGCEDEKGPALKGKCSYFCGYTHGGCMMGCHTAEDELEAIQRELRGVIKQGGLRLHM